MSSGPFIYKGAGKNQRPDADPCVSACRKIACQIQVCLAKNNHMQSRCDGMAKSWEECCDAVKKQQAARNEAAK
jgi:hypothetical protein